MVVAYWYPRLGHSRRKLARYLITRTPGEITAGKFAAGKNVAGKSVAGN
jgi:hypothetical protein